MGSTTDRIKQGITKAMEKVRDAIAKVKQNTVRAVEKGKATAARAEDSVQRHTDQVTDKGKRA